MRVLVVILTAAALVVAGCAGRTSQPAPSAPPAAQAPAAGGTVVTVKMSEFKFELSPAEVPAGKVTFQVENVGTVEHSFIIEALGVKTEQIRPGQTATVTADITPGTYRAHCDVAGHTEAGMTIEFTAR
ncbi:MAG TPA: cupredoxin domain-containing protein [bacterium]|nr:cupredoxin domain-containing protein [bacterium]